MNLATYLNQFFQTDKFNLENTLITKSTPDESLENINTGIKIPNKY